MKIVTADDYQRVRLPGAKPRTKFVCEDRGDGTITLTEVKAEPREAFPRGSLAKYLTAERDREQLALLEGCVQAPE